MDIYRKMHLYHTSSVEIRKPDIYHGRKNADFGQGFYLTPDKEFALRWAAKDAIINEYILNMEGLSVHEFSRDDEWFGYIYNNRSFKDRHAVKLLCIGPEYTQVAVKSKKAGDNLIWVGSEQVDNAEKYKEIVRKEEEEYQKAFAECMQRLSDDD